ncbi:uncharacterized protein [Halyomorpha halys]|uniref:uncharacterized protein n=1 Tax=Halyomorpha halys TaxID=286706 RepID=UPI0006D4FEEC|nr:uncharacterized protein LOC106686936 [Halyomorpha halys]
MDYSPLDQVPYSSYIGELAPFWSFKTNGKFNLIDVNEEPRRRARAAFELAWDRLGRAIPAAQDRMDTAASTDQDPEPPRRPEEFISEHEKPRDVPTRPKYGVPGGWAKGHVQDKKVDIGFVPLQIYSQVRRYDIEEHLPRERAVEEAENEEEKLAAPRLREVLRNKKLHEIYEEEGYEDLGYDHGGYNHHGEQMEDVVKSEGSAIKKLPIDATGRDSDAKGADTIQVFSPISTEESSESIEEEASTRSHVQNDGLTNEVSKLDVKRMVGERALKPRKTVTRSAKQNLTIHVPNKSGLTDRIDIAESRSGSSLESRVINNPSSKITFPGKSSRRLYTSWDIRPQDVQVEETVAVPRPPAVNVHHVASYSPYRVNDPTVTPVQFSASSPITFASTINTYASLINENFSSPLVNSPIEYSEYDTILPSYSTDDYVWAHSNVHEQRVPTAKPIKFEEEVNTSDATTTKSTVSVDLPTLAESSKKQHGRQRGRRRGNAQSSTTESSTEEGTQSSVESATTPIKSSRKSTTNAPRKMYSNFTRGSVKYNPEDDTQWTPTVGTPNIRHPSLPFDTGENKEPKSVKATKEPEIAKPSPKDEPIIRKPGQEEMVGIRDPAANAKYVEQLTLAHFSVPANLAPHPTHFNDQDERLKELAKQLNAPETFLHQEGQRDKRSAIVYDKNKYPLYDSPPSISMDSAVKYATNPNELPKKTYGGMEFYESKESIRCSGPPQPKNILPQREEDGEWKGEPVNNGPRVKGVGDAIECFKRKFFGRDPLDNPLFKEDNAEPAEKIEDAKDFEDTIPLKVNTVDPGERRIMVYGENPVSNLTAEFKIAEPVLKPKFRPYTSRPFVDTVTFTTPRPLSPYSAQYQVYEVNPEDTATPSPYKYKHYFSLHPSNKFQYQLQMARPQKYVPHKLSAYQFVGENTIPIFQKKVPYSAGEMKVNPYSGSKEIAGSYSSGIYRSPMYAHPTEYVEKKIIIRKRETESSLWDMINPLKWWWPNLFDSRRREPRYRRSIGDYDSVMPSPEEIDDVGREMIEMMASDKPTTTVPITLSEFKSKFNIGDHKKTTAARLQGGFLNRNPDITDVIEMLVGMGPTESISVSTTPASTTKPKVVFPRAKLPRRKTYPGTKKPSVISELPTTEATTTTTTTTVPPSTTTRMYKPKRVIKKNYGKGPFDAFTVLRTQQEVKATKQTFTSTEAVDTPTTMRHQDDEPRTLSSETASENDTLTYMVNPATGVGSWSEQRKWKPKRKRPNRPSVYSYHRLKNSSKKKQRDIPDPHQKVYVYGLMSKLLSPHSRAYSSTESSEQQISRRSSEEDYPRDVPVTSVKPPPKFILEPDKRRYYYAKVR